MIKKNENKVLIISSSYYPGIGGVERHTECLCDALSQHTSNLILLTTSSDSEHIEQHDGMKNYTVLRDMPIGYLNRQKYLMKKLPKIIQTYNPGIIHVLDGVGNMFALKYTKLDQRTIPLIITIHNLAPGEPVIIHSKISQFLGKIYSNIYNCIRYVSSKYLLKYGKYDILIAVSERTKELILKYGADEKRVTYIPNGVQTPALPTTKRFRENNDVFSILLVGRFVPHKGQMELLIAAKQLLPQIKNLVVTLVGSTTGSTPDYINNLQKFIAENFQDKQVNIVFNVSDEELEGYYKSADIYIQPSHNEGFCISILEAMVRGIPVIGTNVGAIHEFIGENRGILIEESDPTMIAEAILRMYENRTFREKCGELGRDFVLSEYSWSGVCIKTLEAYHEALQSKLIVIDE